MPKFGKIETGFHGLFLIETSCFQDERGYFSELFQREQFKMMGIEDTFVQENISCSKRGVLRGLHYQENPTQGKLIRVVKGFIYDVVVDLREDSSSYGKWFGITLCEDDFKWLWIPKGFAHGFLSLEENTTIQYFCTEYYTSESERGILWSDSRLGIDWKLKEFGFLEKELILSEKDKRQSSFLETKRKKETEKILILGANGKLGQEFQRFFQRKTVEYIATDYKNLDITREEDSKYFMHNNNVSIVVNCAAYNDVDRAEENRDSCRRINAEAIGIWKQLCQEKNIPFLSFSTDFVFDGEKETPYVETDQVKALSAYGISKYVGENIALDYQKSLLIRTSSLFGRGGDNFCKRVIDWSKEKSELYIVEDQISSPTYTKHLVECTWELLKKECYGLYHISSSGEASKYEQAEYILSCIAWKGKLHRAKTEDFFLLARRPKYSKLDSTKMEFALMKKMPHWKLAIREYLEELGELS